MRKPRTKPLTAKERRDLVFLFSMLVDQMDWLLDNLQQITADSDGDIILSWLRVYVSDMSGEVNAVPQSLWDGGLADYCVQRDQLIEQWWLANMGCG